MKKFKNLILIIVLSLFLMVGCGKKLSDSEKFKEEYTKVSDYNVFVYKDADEIINILSHGTGIVYLGFPECPWCQAYVPMLNEVADTEGLEKISYYNILEDRKNNTSEYKKMVEILNDYLRYDDDGNKRIYVPAVISVKEGEIIGFDDESSYDTLGFDDPEDYWIEERVKDLKLRLSDMISPIVDNKCTDCNLE